MAAGKLLILTLIVVPAAYERSIGLFKNVSRICRIEYRTCTYLVRFVNASLHA